MWLPPVPLKKRGLLPLSHQLRIALLAAHPPPVSPQKIFASSPLKTVEADSICSNIPGAASRPPSKTDSLVVWARHADYKQRSGVLHSFSEFGCLVCPEVTCIRETDFLRLLRGKSHKARVFALSPKYYRTCIAGPFATRGLWLHHLFSRKYETARHT